MSPSRYRLVRGPVRPVRKTFTPLIRGSGRVCGAPARICSPAGAVRPLSAGNVRGARPPLLNQEWPPSNDEDLRGQHNGSGDRQSSQRQQDARHGRCGRAQQCGRALRSGLRPPPRREDGRAGHRSDPRQGRPVPRVHARRGQGVQRHRRESGTRPRLHLEVAGRGGRDGRHRRPRAGRHRARGIPPRDGGQGDPLQAVRRGRRGADRAGHHRRGRDHRDRGAPRAVLRRGEPGGHLGPPVLRDRAQAPGTSRHPGLPRRPARHCRGDPRGPAQRGQAVRPDAR